MGGGHALGVVRPGLLEGAAIRTSGRFDSSREGKRGLSWAITGGYRFKVVSELPLDSDADITLWVKFGFSSEDRSNSHRTM
jgi:hypothetical protein